MANKSTCKGIAWFLIDQEKEKKEPEKQVVDLEVEVIAK